MTKEKVLRSHVCMFVIMKGGRIEPGSLLYLVFAFSTFSVIKNGLSTPE